MFHGAESPETIRAYRSELDAVIDRVAAETTASRLLNPDAHQRTSGHGRLSVFPGAFWARLRPRVRETERAAPAHLPEVS